MTHAAVTADDKNYDAFYERMLDHIDEIRLPVSEDAFANFLSETEGQADIDRERHEVEAGLPTLRAADMIDYCMGDEESSIIFYQDRIRSMFYDTLPQAIYGGNTDTIRSTKAAAAGLLSELEVTGEHAAAAFVEQYAGACQRARDEVLGTGRS